eukprot:720883-Hanusia_phi.AAC.1
MVTRRISPNFGLHTPPFKARRLTFFPRQPPGAASCRGHGQAPRLRLYGPGFLLLEALVPGQPRRLRSNPA